MHMIIKSSEYQIFITLYKGLSILSSFDNILKCPYDLLCVPLNTARRIPIQNDTTITMTIMVAKGWFILIVGAKVVERMKLMLLELTYWVGDYVIMICFLLDCAGVCDVGRSLILWGSTEREGRAYCTLCTTQIVCQQQCDTPIRCGEGKAWCLQTIGHRGEQEQGQQQARWRRRARCCEMAKLFFRSCILVIVEGNGSALYEGSASLWIRIDASA